MGWGWAFIRGWALINFFCLLDGHLFEVGANSRLGAYSHKYGTLASWQEDFRRQLSSQLYYVFVTHRFQEYGGPNVFLVFRVVICIYKITEIVRVI